MLVIVAVVPVVTAVVWSRVPWSGGVCLAGMPYVGVSIVVLAVAGDLAVAAADDV